jgi:hypothetical protein
MNKDLRKKKFFFKTQIMAGKEKRKKIFLSKKDVK